MRISADRALYLSRLLTRSLKAERELATRVDDDTLRRAINREISEAAKELEAIEERVRTSVERRGGAASRDADLLYARSLEDELRKHGA
jgi:hypothetical protein